MAEDPGLDKLPQAAVVRKKRMRISIVWIIPILAAIVAIGIAVQRVVSEGPTITITFRAAEGIEAGKSFIKYKDVRIGQVTAVTLSDDYSKVQVTAKIAKHAAGLMVADARFWVVEPRINLSGVSGLSTLLSGNYIGFEAGKSDESERKFVGLDDPPFIPGQRGRRFILKAESIGSLGIGAPVYYRQLNVGQIASYNLANDGKSVEISAFVQSPYDKYITRETRFWNASGIDISLGANGVNVHTESLVALLAGGVAFETPPMLPTAEPAPPNATFTLYSDRATAMKQPEAIERRYVIFFSESVRGLSVGAPVTFFGIPVGEVTDVGLTMETSGQLFRPRVLITFFPDRLIESLTPKERADAGKEMTAMTDQERLRILKGLIDRGLRAQLRTGSLLTGELYVAMEYFPGAPKVKVDWNRDPLEVPAVPGGLANIEAKLSSILAKIDSLPFNALASDVKIALATLDQTLKDTDVLVKGVDAQWVPEGTKTLEGLRGAISQANSVLKNTDATFFGGDSPAPQDLRDALQELTRAARAVRILADYLERHPEMLIRGKPEEKK